jgi:hypothetical protein
MTIKKMLLLVSAMAAIAAFTAPAAAQAAYWYTDHLPSGPETLLGNEEEALTVDGTGELSSTVTGVITGPAVVHFHGDIWNDFTTQMGEGAITDFVITAPVGGIPTNLPGCSATATNSTTDAEGNPLEEWPITLSTPVEPGQPAGVAISNVTFTNHYNHQCQTFGLPATAPAAGTVTGSIASGSDCIRFVNAGDLETENGLDTVAINGEVCVTDPGGGKITAR